MRTEQNGTERNRTEQNGTERNRTAALIRDRGFVTNALRCPPGVRGVPACINRSRFDAREPLEARAVADCCDPAPSRPPPPPEDSSSPNGPPRAVAEAVAEIDREPVVSAQPQSDGPVFLGRHGRDCATKEMAWGRIRQRFDHLFWCCRALRSGQAVSVLSGTA